MAHKRSGRILILAMMLGFWLISACQAGEVYTLGVVPQFEPRRLLAAWKPIVDELQRRTGLTIQLTTSLTVPEFEGELEKGSFDFVYANPYHILHVRKSQGYLPLVHDAEPLRGILVVRKDSPIRDLRDLKGKTLAIPSPNALGASLLLRADLERLYGIKMNTLNVKTHSSVYLNVINGLADAGGGVEKTLEEQDSAVKESLRILYTTRELPAHPIAAHPRVKPAIREQVKAALLAMAASPGTRELFKRVPIQNLVATSIDDFAPMSQWGLESFWMDERK